MFGAVVALGLAAGCGGGSNTEAPKASGAAVGGGPATPIPTSLQAAGPLLGSVTSAVPGLSSAQAATGVGGLLELAKAKMPADHFAQVANAIPGSDALMNQAVKAGVPTSGLTGPSTLNGAFAKAG